MANNKRIKGLDENGHIPVWGAKQSDPSINAAAHKYMEGREKIIANDFSSDIQNSSFYSPELMPDVWQLPKSLHGKTYLLCDDNKERTIKEIVDNKLLVKVLTYNLKTQQKEFSEVLNYFQYPCDKDCVSVEYKIKGKLKKIKCTKDHRIYTKNREYVEAQDLMKDDLFLILEKDCKVIKVKKIKRFDRVYDIETKNLNFFANGILVHNSKNELLKWLNHGTNLAMTENSWKMIQDITTDDKIMSLNNKFVKVLNVIRKNYEGKMIKVITHLTHTEINVSENHPMLGIKRPLDKKGLPLPGYFRWMNIKDEKDILGYARMLPSQNLERGDILVMPKNKEERKIMFIELDTALGNKSIPAKIEINEEVAWMLGWFVAEGWTTNNNIQFQLANDEWDVAYKIRDIFKKYFNVNCVIKPHNPDHPRLTVCSVSIAMWFKQTFGNGSHNKHLSPELINMPTNIANAFLKGWFDGDAGNTVSKKLADDIFLMVLNTGKLPYCSNWKLDINKLHAIQGKKIKTCAEKCYKVDWDDNVEGKKEKKYMEDDNYFYVPIESVENYDYKGMCYDLLTEDQSYCMPFVSYACSAQQHIVTDASLSEISELNIGQRILAADGTNQLIVDKISRDYNGDMQRIDTDIMPSTHMTDADVVLGIKVKRPYFNDDENIKFKNLVYDKNNTSYLQKHLTWITASIISPDDLVVVPRFKEEKEIVIDLKEYIPKNKKGKIKYSVTDKEIICKTCYGDEYKIIRYIKMNEQLAELLGYYYVSGVARKTDISFSNINSFKKVSDLFKNIWGIKGQYVGKQDARGRIKIPLLAEWFMSMGIGGRNNKNIHDIILYANKKCVKIFLDAYLQNNSKRQNDYIITESNISQKLLLLSTKIGYMCEIIPFTNTNQFKVTIKENNTSLNDNDFYYLPVKNNKQYHYIGDLKHITTESGTFVDGIVKHNCRFFYNTDPYIYAITNMHYLFPFSAFQATASDEKITEYYKKVSYTRDFNLFDHILDMSLAYSKFGEAICLGQPDEVDYEGEQFFKWKGFILFEPEVIQIYKSVLERKENYTLIVTPEFKEEMRRMKNKGKDLGPLLDDALNYNKTEVDLDGQYISKIINKTDPSALRGTSPIQPLLRTLMFQDKVNLLKVTAIERYRNPLEIWKIGDMNGPNPVIPDMNMLKGFEQMIKSAKENPPYALFIPPYVNFDVAGYSSQKSMFDYKDDYDHVRDAILVGMGVSKDLIMGEQKGWGNSKQLTMHKLMMMYSTTRAKFDNWLTNNYYWPIAEKNGFVDDKGNLNLPQIVWEKDLSVDRSTPEEYLKLYDKGLISTKTLFSVFKGLDIQQEQELLIDEINSVFDNKKRIPNRTPKPIGKKEETPKSAEQPKDEEGGGNEPPSATAVTEPIAPEAGGGAAETPETPATAEAPVAETPAVAEPLGVTPPAGETK